MEAGEANPSLGAWPVFCVSDAHPSLAREGSDDGGHGDAEVKELPKVSLLRKSEPSKV